MTSPAVFVDVASCFFLASEVNICIISTAPCSVIDVMRRDVFAVSSVSGFSGELRSIAGNDSYSYIYSAAATAAAAATRPRPVVKIQTAIKFFSQNVVRYSVDIVVS